MGDTANERLLDESRLSPRESRDVVDSVMFDVDILKHLELSGLDVHTRSSINHSDRHQLKLAWKRADHERKLVDNFSSKSDAFGGDDENNENKGDQIDKNEQVVNWYKRGWIREEHGGDKSISKDFQLNEQWKLCTQRYTYYNDPNWWYPTGFLRRINIFRPNQSASIINTFARDSLVNSADVDKAFNAIAGTCS
jgi:hypothetical protein